MQTACLSQLLTYHVWFASAMTRICILVIICILIYFTLLKTVPSFLRFAGLQRLSQKLFIKVIYIGSEPCLTGKENNIKTNTKKCHCTDHLPIIVFPCQEKGQLQSKCLLLYLDSDYEVLVFRKFESKRIENIPCASVGFQINRLT